jgi:hypothetical protein
MSRRLLEGTRTACWDLRLAPSRAPRRLERVAAACLQAEPEDSRLGDLSERYVHVHEHARRHLGTTLWAMAVSRLVADLYYLAATASVCCRAGSRSGLAGRTPPCRSFPSTCRGHDRAASRGREAVITGNCGRRRPPRQRRERCRSTWRTEALAARLRLEKAEAAAVDRAVPLRCGARPVTASAMGRPR